jgi:hypothetical protein
MTIAEYRSPLMDDSDRIEDYLSLDWLLARKVIPCEIHLGSFHPLMLVLFFNSKSHLKLLSLNAVIPDAYFREIGSCPSLIDLRLLEWSDGHSLPVMDRFFQSNPQLQKVGIQYAFDPQIITSLIKHCPNVTHLDLFESEIGLTDKLMLELSQSHMNLTYLNLDVSQLSDQSIRVILDSFPNLHYLSITDPDISPEMDALIIKRVIVPSLKNADAAIQLMGLQSLETCSIEVNHPSVTQSY